MGPRWDVIGAPSSAGAHTPGVERAPAALREAGVVELISGAGGEVDDVGDVPGFRWRPDPLHPRGQNAAEVVRVAADVAELVEASVRHGRSPLVLGGDCTVTIGLVAGLARAGAQPALVYVDGGPDLYTPETRANGNLDGMGVAHMLSIPGSLPAVAAIGPHTPLLTSDRVVFYGGSLPPGDHERDLVKNLGITYVTADEVYADPMAAMARALAAVESATTLLVHFDVDVLRFVDAPLADVPEPFGLTLAEASSTISTLVASPRFVGMSVTEINPDHLPNTQILPQFTRMLANALTRRLTGDDRSRVSL